MYAKAKAHKPGRVGVVKTLNSARWVRLVGRIVGVAALAGTATINGCGTSVAECALDSDCDQGQACELSECVHICGTDVDCLEGEVCLKGTTTPLRICQTEAAVANNGDPVSVAMALLRDASDTCDSQQPGADVAFVLLEDYGGAVVGWGSVVAGSTTGDANAFGSWEHIDGGRPDAGADSCPVRTPDSVCSLGCDGFIAIDFRDAAGAIVPIERGRHRIRVGELGPQCEDEEADTYDVFLCPGASSEDDVPGACTVAVGTGSGERAFEL